MKKKLIAFLFLIAIFPVALFAFESSDEYQMAISAVKSASPDIALLHFLTVINETKKTKHYKDSLFAVGEYYFTIGNYNESFRVLTRFIKEYPTVKEKPFALLYLLKISIKSGQEELTGQIRQEILNAQHLILLFRNTKEYKYKSPFGTKYKLIYHIDRAEFYLDGELSEQLYY